MTHSYPAMTGTDLIEKFNKTRRYTEAQCEPLMTEDYIPQPVAFISPPKWHLGHTTWFFEEFILKQHKQGYQIYDEDFAFVFNSYYNNVGKRVLQADRGNLTRPGVEKVYDYRKYVDTQLHELFVNAGGEVFDLLELGIHHEQQHQELLYTDLKYILGHNPLFPAYKPDFDLTRSYNKDDGFVYIEEGIHSIGYEGDGFCYDNERSRHKVFLHESEISKSLVTNDVYLEFIDAGGYRNFNLWLDEGWSWVNSHDIKSPLYWHKIDGEWFHYTLAGLRPVDPRAIVCHINYYEAAALAEWLGLRLPTEFEWEVAASDLKWGSRWEWTSSAYNAYPGFDKPEGAIGEYNGKFMVNQMVLRGGSSATSPDHSRITYRNFFHPHYSWQFTGIRLAKKQSL